MANPVHLEKLCQGPKAWNEWRDANPYVVPDLSHATLALSQRQFGPSNGGPIDLRAVDLEGAMLRFATLTEADLEGANLKGADLTHARLDRAKLIAADLTDAMLDHADLTAANLTRTVIMGCTFVNARNLTQPQIEQAFGDATTVLPVALTPPASWFAPLEDDGAFPQYPVPELDEEEDLYDILGLSNTAQADEIRAAHRALVKKLHPDLNPGDNAAQDSFKKVSNAYSILGDPEKRAAYDKGEIDSDGRTRPEFEARREFRKYAFRFYAAAVVALFLTAGALAFVWHQVLRTTGEGSRTALAAPKQTERLTALPSQKPQIAKPDARERQAAATKERVEPSSNSEAIGPQKPSSNSEAFSPRARPEGIGQQKPAKPDADRGVRETPPMEQARTPSPEKAVAAVPPQEEHSSQPEQREAAHPAGPPGQGKAVKAANPEPAPAKSETAGDSSPREVTARPLGEAHKEGQAGEAQAASARSDTPEGQAQTSDAPQDRQAAGEDGSRQQAVRTYMPKAGQDPITSLFRARAIEQTVAKDPAQATASIDTHALGQGRAEEVEGQATADAHTQSPPGAAKQRRTPAFLDQRARRNQKPAASVVVEVPATDIPAPEPRRQAVSDILAGGL